MFYSICILSNLRKNNHRDKSDLFHASVFIGKKLFLMYIWKILIQSTTAILYEIWCKYTVHFKQCCQNLKTTLSEWLTVSCNVSYTWTANSPWISWMNIAKVVSWTILPVCYISTVNIWQIIPIVTCWAGGWNEIVYILFNINIIVILFHITAKIPLLKHGSVETLHYNNRWWVNWVMFLSPVCYIKCLMMSHNQLIFQKKSDESS